MAEFAVSTVVEKLTSWITEEALLLEGVGDKVEQLRDELRWMQSFLKDVDAKQEKNERLRIWVSQIREVALDAEDVVETYIAEAASHSSWNIPAKLINLHHAGKKIEKIRSRVQNISRQKEHFGITGTAQEGREGTSASPNERLRWWRQTSPNIEEDDLVDLVEDTKASLTQLSSMDPCRRVVSIVGMGGLGKTTLAKKLYNHCDITKQFDCKAFVYVSKDYRRRDALQRIIVAVSPDCNMEDLKKLEEEALISKLHELLKDRRYRSCIDISGPNLGGLQSMLKINGHAEIGFIYKDFKLLRVLDGVPAQSRAIGAVGNLVQLRYLGLVSRSDFKHARSLKSWARFAFELPRSIGKLKNLLILKLENCIPDVIWKMKNLRHLFLSGTNPTNLRLDTLSNLRTLKNLGSGRWIEDGGLVKLTNLQRLKIVGLKEANLNSVFSNIEGLHCLESLSLEFRENESLPPPLRLSHFEHLRKLHLDGKIVKLPARREFPPNLIKLRLLNSDLEQDSIRKLERLPNLQMLLLGAYSYNSKKLVCRRRFPQLRILHIEDIPNLELIVKASAMKMITDLKVSRCPGASIKIHGDRYFRNIEVLDSSLLEFSFLP